MSSSLFHSSPKYVGGLDTLRFICALSVMLCHLGGPPVLAWLDKSHGLGKAAHGLYGSLFPGAPAVIVFFLISGFCIHYPNSQPGGCAFNALSFYIRRFIRIALPVYVLEKLITATGRDFGEIDGVVIWSVHCEMIYYAAYPVLRVLNRWLSWQQITALAFAGAAVALWLHRGQNEFLNLGVKAASMVGLPCWLLGLLVAESASRPWAVSGRIIAVCRLGIYGLACSATVLRFHGGIGFPLSLVFFSMACYVWLRFELAWRRMYPSPAWLEKGGAWSYSLYLLHFPALSFVGGWLGQGTGTWLGWTAIVGSALVISYVYYLAVEKPSHALAKWLGRHVEKVMSR
jgi:peptidoglycan/LPS O-acetylase OafA/YrhL